MSRLDPRPLTIQITTSFQGTDPKVLSESIIEIPVLTTGRGDVIEFTPDFSSASADLANELRRIANLLDPTP